MAVLSSKTFRYAIYTCDRSKIAVLCTTHIDLQYDVHLAVIVDCGHNCVSPGIPKLLLEIL